MSVRVLLLLTLIPAMLSPVALPALDFALGVQAGGMLSRASGPTWEEPLDDDDGENGSLFSFTWGAFLRYGITGRFSLQPEIIFSLRGGKAYYEYPAGEATGTYTERCMEIPLFARFLVPVGKGGIVLMTGPALFLALDDLEYRTEGLIENTEYLAPESGVRLGIAIAAGYEYPAGPILLTGEIRYSRPLAYPADDTEVIIDAASLLFGIGFPL